MSYLRYLCSSLPPVVCRRDHVLFTLFVFVFTSDCRRAHVLFTLFVFVWYSGVQHILCCVFVLFFFVLCTLLPVSFDCPSLIAPSVFS
jgi:hypothetical protein